MKRFNIVILFLLTIVSFAYPIDFRSGDRVIIGDADTIKSDLFVGARSLDVRGIVDGDVYAGCERITIDGNVTDDIRTAGREIVIRGNVGDGVIAFGQTIMIDGDVKGDVISYGGEVRVSGRIGGNLYLGCGGFYLEGGQIDGKIDGTANISSLDGMVGDSVKLTGEKVTFGDHYRADKGTHLVLSKEPGAEMTKNAPENLEVTVVPPEPFYQKLYFYWSFLAAFVFGLLMTLIFKNFLQNYLVFAKKKIGLTFGVGVILLVATPITVIFLLILFLTIPTALILAGAFIVLLYISTIFAAVVLGDFIQNLFAKKGQKMLILSLLIGLIITTLLAEVPYAGWFLSLVIVCFGTGSLSRFLWSVRKPNKRTVTKKA
jgi:cytoskeletal protein CcmA (bactofilin family)